MSNNKLNINLEIKSNWRDEVVFFWDIFAWDINDILANVDINTKAIHKKSAEVIYLHDILS